MNRSSSELIVFPDGTKYRRTGDCSQCGECCTYISLPLARSLTGDEKRWAELHAGIQIIGQSVRIETPCSALTDGKCALFGTPERPQLCSDYPELPGLDSGCSYQFEEVK